MSTLLTINVKNLEPATQGFFFFQEPATYTGGAKVYSNSLFAENLANYGTAGSILTFQVDLQYYAGIQEAHSAPTVGQSSGYSSASRPIDLAPAGGGSANDSTTATVSPALGLSTPTNETGVQAGAFRINTPSFSSPPFYNVGSAVSANGGIVLSNFVQANPQSHTDCEPILKYYVATGTYTPGTVMDFTAASKTSALCDFTGGYTVIDVELAANGDWNITSRT
ncbi:hypothetical protein [Phaeobacter porticola]|uniref:Uncharacterized protein n=1 Tax=Phaeobacter porticola TaxID=1844006 RepID=A0A1L3I036_9RHOB|nr:hypothetical protein [Phaeobacter porticola]APG45483.1 hypothetical protein PhaeoP97_00025 [Phaeobacter porticola]